MCEDEDVNESSFVSRGFAPLLQHWPRCYQSRETTSGARSQGGGAGGAGGAGGGGGGRGWVTNLVNTKSETKPFNKSIAINIQQQKSLSYLEYSIDTSYHHAVKRYFDLMDSQFVIRKPAETANKNNKKINPSLSPSLSSIQPKI